MHFFIVTLGVLIVMSAIAPKFTNYLILAPIIGITCGGFLWAVLSIVGVMSGSLVSFGILIGLGTVFTGVVFSVD